MERGAIKFILKNNKINKSIVPTRLLRKIVVYTYATRNKFVNINNTVNVIAIAISPKKKKKNENRNDR